MPKETIATRHNNPLNMKYGGATKKYIDSGEAVLGEKAIDGGRFLKFKTPELGRSAAKDLLFDSNVYKDLDVDSAMRKWSNSGYGAEVSPGIEPTTKITQLTEDERDRIISNMARQEGFGTEIEGEDDTEEVSTPGKLRKYKVTNKKTGESTEALFPGPPSQEEIGKIFTTRATHKRQKEISEATERERPITAKLADLIYAPSEAIAPEVMAPEEIEKLPTTTRLKRLGQEFASDLTSPENWPGLAAATFGGPVGMAGAGIAYGPQMVKGAYESGKQFLERPSLETGARAGIQALGVGLAGAGIYKGSKGYVPKGRIERALGMEKAPQVKPPTTPTSRAPISRQIPERAPIEAEFVEPLVTPPPTERLGLLPKRTEQITGDVPRTPEGAIRARASTLPEQELIVEAPGRRQITGITERQPGEPIITPPPTEIAPGQGQLTGEILGDVKQIEAYFGNLNKKNSQALLARRDKVVGKEKILIDDILKRRGLLPDESEVFELEKPIEAPIPSSPEKGAYLTRGGKTVHVPEEEIGPMKEKGFKESVERRRAGVKREFKGIERRQIVEEGPHNIRVEAPLENIWLREQESSVLQAMREGSSGQLRKEIDSVLGERGLGEKTTTTTKPKIEEEVLKLDEPAFEKYNEQLESLVSQDHVESQSLRDLAEQGKQAGLDFDTVVQDLIDNMPRVNNASNRAYQAANRVFKKGEAGFGTIDFFTGRAAKKAKGTEAEGPVNQAREQISAFEKYWTKPERVIGRMGESGQKLEQMIENAQYEADSLKGKVDILAHDAFRNLTPKEVGQRIAIMKDGKEIILNAGNMDKYVDWDKGVFRPKAGVQRITRMRGSLSNVILDNAEPANPKIAQAAEQFKQAMDILGTAAEESAVSTISSEGKYIPFTKMGYEYWPRDYTEGFFKSLDNNPTDFNKIVKEVADSKKISLKEAEEMLKNKKLYAELTTRGQHQRTLKQDSFVIDPEVIYNHINSFSGRIGMAKSLGPEDVRGSLVNKELTQLMNEGWDRKFASDTIERLVGREGKKDVSAPGESTVYKAITDLNNARLMTSFVINNLGGITPMVARVGEINTLKGLGAYLGNMEVARRMATLSGARKGGIIERGGSDVGKILGIPMSERFIRTWADQSGRATTHQLVDYLSSDKMRPSSPQYIRGKRLLDSLLGKDTTETIQRGVALPEEISRAGWQLSKDTQGLINPATFPDVWQQASNNMWVNLAMQYKRMAAQSMGSLIESFKLNPVRAIKAITITGPIIGELIGDTGSALFGALAGTYTGEGAAKAAIRDVEQRGESLAKAASPILKKKLGLSESQAKIVGRYIEDMNRGFALGLIGDLIYSAAYWGGQAGADIVSGGISPAYEFGWDIAKSIMDEGNDLVYTLLPQRIGSSIKRSEKEMKGGPPLVRPPRLPRLP